MNREQVIDYVLLDGRNLEKLGDNLRNDFEVVAAAILGEEFGGATVLQYANPSLQNNQLLLSLTEKARDLIELRFKINNSNLDTDIKNRLISEINNSRSKLLKEVVAKYQSDNKDNSDVELDSSISLDVPKLTKEYIDKALVGTQLNKTDYDVMEQIAKKVSEALMYYSYTCDKSGESFLITNYLSRKSIMYGIPLRCNLEDTYEDASYHSDSEVAKKTGIHDVRDVSSNILFSIDLIKLAVNSIGKDNPLGRKFARLLSVLDYSLIMQEKDRQGGVRDNKKYSELLNNELENISRYDYYQLFSNYHNTLDYHELFEDKDIEVSEVTDTGREILANFNNYSLDCSLYDSYHGELLDGDIQVSSDIGYKDTSKGQMDAVGSLAKDKTHFINIVADGVGSSAQGDDASRTVVRELLNYYDSLPDYAKDDLVRIEMNIQDLLERLNGRIFNQYHGMAATTLVLSITAGDKTLIMNIGDSTAYSYDEENDDLKELTTLDSHSYGLSYEDARHNPSNNIITAYIGAPPMKYHYCHSVIIDNKGQRIILSSDGVTDLVSEENFKKYFKMPKVNSEDIIDKAKNNPDSTIYKSEDNIAVIVVELPDGSYNKGRGF